MGLLVSQKLFPIDIRYTEIPLKTGQTGVVVLKDDAAGKELEKKYGDKVKTLHTQWAQPNFRESNDILREATVYDQFKGERDIDWYLFRALTLERNLKAWDIMDDDGKPVPCTPDNIAKLDSAIAIALVGQFDARNLPTEEDLKK